MTARGSRRRPRRQRLGAALGALLATLVVLAPAAAQGTPSSPPQASAAAPTTSLAAAAGAPRATTDATDVVVDVTRVEPQVLRPGEDLRVTVRVENRREAPVAEPRVLLHLDRRAFISRTSLDRWRTSGTDDPVGSTVATLDLEEPLAPRASATVTVTVPAASVGLRRGYAAWGPRGIAAETVDRADPARARLGLARTFLLWFPIEEVTPTRVSTLVPLVGPPVDPYGLEWVGELEELTSESGRLGRVLAATAEHPEVTWVLDPWLVDVTADGVPGGTEDDGEAGPEGDGSAGTSDGDAGDEGDGPHGAEGSEGTDGDAADGPGGSGIMTEAPGGDVPLDVGPFGPPVGATAAAGARSWAESLLDATVRRDVELLPYLDPDVAALAHAEDTERLAAARALAEDVVARTALPDGAAASLAWPVDPLPDRVTAELATSHGERALVVDPGQLPRGNGLTYTPSGRTTVPTDRGDVVVLVPDERLSAALRTGSVLGTGGPAPRATPAVAAQDLLAELAVITRERPSDSRHMLLTAPRDWSPDPAVVDAQLTALERAPWVQEESVSALVGAPSTADEQDRLPRRVVAGSEVRPDELETVTEAVTTRLRVAQMVEDPDALTGDTELELLAPAAAAWRADPPGRAALVDRSVAGTDALRSSIEVLQGSAVNLVATSGDLPVRIGNALPQDATVAVMLQPGDARLRIDEPVRVTVPAGGEQLVRIPVHAIQSADLQVGVTVTTLQGDVVDDDTVLLVRVRAEWEGIGTAVIGGLLALGLVVGIVRAIRQGRRRGRRAQPVVDDGPDALSPEAAEEDAEQARDAAGTSTPTSQHAAGRPGGT